MIYALDTNTITLLEHQSPVIVATTEAKLKTDTVAIPAFARIEVLEGRFQSVRKAANGIELDKAVDRLRTTEQLLALFTTLPFDKRAFQLFDLFISPAPKKVNISRGDLLIACIALAHDATLVTRNVKDFAKIPNLKIENWAT